MTLLILYVLFLISFCPVDTWSPDTGLETNGEEILIVVCPQCRGNGYRVTPFFDYDNHQFKAKCWPCKGTGSLHPWVQQWMRSGKDLLEYIQEQNKL